MIGQSAPSVRLPVPPMSLPDEKRRALLLTHAWLTEELHRSNLSQAMKQEIRLLLRHWPSKVEIEQFTVLGEA